MEATAFNGREFHKIFVGNTEAFGRHIPGTKNEKGKKQGKSFTINEQVTFTNYFEHLEGKVGLGIVPLNKEGKVKFVVIDIDNYNEKYVSSLVKRIYFNKLPLLPFRSKSGGLHLYMFFDKLYEYSKLKNNILQFLPVLSLSSNVEIFPKQTQLKQGSIGNWINLPYFNHHKTEQYLIGQDLKPVLLTEALETIKKNLLSEEQLENYVSQVHLGDAPPCLQNIYFTRSTDYRNDYLFNAAIYLKAKYNEDFENQLFELNKELLEPLPEKEIMDTLVKSHKRKDYSYKCNLSPLKDCCLKNICKNREYGIGTSHISELTFEDFIKYDSDPPYYEWIVNGKSLTFFNEIDIIRQDRFRELCMREIHVLPTKLKVETWTGIVNRALSNIIIKEIELDEDMSPGATFRKYLYDFLENRIHAENKSQILIDRVFLDMENKEYIFRNHDLIYFLKEVKRFSYFRTTEIQSRLRKMGCQTRRIYIDKNNSSIRVWTMAFDIMKSFKVDPTEGFEVDFTKMGEFENEEQY